MKIDIRLLGTVELRVDGQLVMMGAAKRRAVLAGLALEANRPVSLDRLSDMVWADSTPASAVANLRSHVAGLRRAVGDRLVAHPGGYELRLAAGELDVVEFLRLATDARAGRDNVVPAAVIGQLTDALAQWRGPAGGGVPRSTSLDNRWATLDEQRLQIFEELAEVRLTVGEHADLLAGLREHLAAHPLRERAWGQLMLALYRCGDTPAALSAYRAARDSLYDQLGIEPGSELATLHRAMLDRSPELSWVPPVVAEPVAVARDRAPAVHGRWVAPRELPADLVTFVGRTRELADVVAAVTGPTPAVAVVCGPAGGGKSALAVRAAHTVADAFPDGQVYVDLGYRTDVPGEEVVARVLRSLGVAAADVPQHPEERAGRLRSRLAGRRLLLVVDGVTHAAQVRPLVPAGPGPALVVVGQRQMQSLDGVRRITVGAFGDADGRSLLGALAGAERLDADPAATRELLRLCSGSPLALRVAGARLAGRPALPMDRLVEQIGDGRRRLDWLAHGDLSMRDRLATGFAAVRSKDEVAGRLIELLGSAPDGQLLPDSTAARLGVTAERVWRALEELIDTHLVYLDESAGYRLPALVREYAAELTALPPVPRQLIDGWRIVSGERDRPAFQGVLEHL
ncbi:BTAD domain-containing putative transcriptional regulator [Micromonospora taraxaci]|uniref:AfsR/SARP family transcriptional regulator n=1 Tax=Micromonospora taraxaci TaxID=1316803 RepID=UPI0033EBD1B8